MAEIGATYLTIADGLKQTEGGKTTATIIELLAENNELLLDASAIECNNGTSHRHTIRTGLPSATWRQLYGYVTPSKSSTAQVDDGTGNLEAYSVVDVDLVKMQKNPAQFRLNEAKAFLEAMNQEAQDNIFYGSVATNAAKFDGLALRYASLAASKTNIGYNCVSAGGVGSDNTSIWLVTWGETHTSLLYPQGSQAGLVHSDDGIQTETDSNGAKRKVYQDHFQWKLGVSVHDWRSTARVCNIDASLLAAGSVAIEDYMLQAFYKIKRYSKTGKTIVYANTDTLYGLHKRAKDKTNVHLDIKDFAGKEVVTFMGMPIRECDQILNTESVVS